MENNNEATEKLQGIVDKTNNRVKSLTSGELLYIFKHLNGDEVDLIKNAIKSENAIRIASSIQMPVHRMMQEIVQGKREEPII